MELSVSSQMDKARKALVVEDEPEIRNLLVLYAKRSGLDCLVASSTDEASRLIETHNFSLVLLDWMLPGESGPAWLKRMRQSSKFGSVPVLMITAKSAPNDIVAGLECGADDFLVKPFDPSVLVARINALLRRSEKASLPPANEIRVGELVLNIDMHKVMCSGAEVHLTPSEFKLLETLLQNRGRVLTRDSLIEQVQGLGVSVVGRTVDTHVFGLRKKLEKCGEYIETVRGVGYRVV